MCITIVFKPACDVIKFEIKLIILIKPFFYMTKMSRQKLKYIENEKSFRGEIKSIFTIFKGLSVAKNCIRPDSAPLSRRSIILTASVNKTHHVQVSGLVDVSSEKAINTVVNIQ